MLAALFFAVPLWASTAEETLAALCSLPELKNALWGIDVVDLETGKTILEKNKKTNFVPASTLKLFVTAAALDKFGANKRFKTELYYSGKLKNGILAGNILIKGFGDASLGSEFIKTSTPIASVFETWAKALQKAGIKQVEGAVLADDTLFEAYQPGSWAWEDIGNYYAASPSALSIHDNLYRIYFEPAKKIGAPAIFLRTEPVLEGMVFEFYVKTAEKNSGDNVFIYSFPSIEKAIVRGTLPLGDKVFDVKGSLPEPALSAAREFTKYLQAYGISVSAGAGLGVLEKGYRKAAVTKGVPLRDIVRVTNKRSFNLYAEILLRQLAASKGYKPAAAEDGLKELRAFLEKLNVDIGEFKAVDASGLSRRNLVKAETFTALLRAIAKKKWFNDYFESLVFPSDTEAFGHIKRFGRNLPENTLRLKSGSLNGVRSYAGYLTAKSGKKLAFAFILNNYAGSPAKIDFYHEKLITSIYENN